MEVAVVHSAIPAHADRLVALLGDTSLPAISISNMQIELSATNQMLGKLSTCRFEAVNAVTVKNVGAAERQYREFCRLLDYRKPGVEVGQYTEAEAFALTTRKPVEEPVANLLPAEQTEWSTQ